MKTTALLFYGTVMLGIKVKFLPDLNLMGWVFVLMLVDFITGLIKAKLMSVARTSTGFRRSLIKFVQYGCAILVSIVLRNTSGVDSTIMQYANDGILVFIIYIEAASIFENIYACDQDSRFAKFFIKPILSLLLLGIEKKYPTEVKKENAGN